MPVSLDISLGPQLTEDEAAAIFEQGKEAVVFALLQLARMPRPMAVEGASSPGTPSGMVPPYQKPAKSSRRKKPGRKVGHPGVRRAAPERIDRREDHRLEACPDCGGRLSRGGSTRTRYVEDIPHNEPEVVEHTIHRDWCSRRRKTVEPKVPGALPGATLGNRVLVLSAWLHYALGNTLSQIVDVFNFHLQMKITPGGLIKMWYRLKTLFEAWYRRIQREALQAAVLHADETGWRVNGQTHWLWCFATRDATFYLIDRSRGSPALQKFFVEEFQGALLTDFWSAYDAVVCGDRQRCWPHLLRELVKVESRAAPPGEDWPEFRKKLKRLFGDAVRLKAARDSLAEDVYDRRVVQLEARVQALAQASWSHADARRLAKRLRRYGNELLTFLWYDDVPPDNNHGEREIRPAVLIRKNSYNNRSEQGASCQAALMSIFRTLKKRGHDPIPTLCNAIAQWRKTGTLPPLPANAAEVR